MEQTLMFFGALVVLPIISAICAYFYRRKVQQLPEYQRLALEQFAKIAVQSIEQIHKKMLSNDTKKQYATDVMTELYKACPQLKEPAREIMEIALESAVYQLKAEKPL